MRRDKAAIRRATYAAHRAVEQLDSASMKQIEAAYRQAAADIAERIAAHAGPDANLALQEMRSVLFQVEERLRALSDTRNTLINVSLERAAELGTEPFSAEIKSAAAMRVSDEAMRFVRNFVAEDGLQLSDRLWRLDRGARDKVVNAIEQAVILGQGAAQAAREFLARGEPVPIDVQGKIDAANAPRLAKQTSDQLLTGTGAPLDNAMRLMRTEINRAHGEAYMLSGADHPDFAGWRFLLSPAHPKPDICDLLSRQNLHGLGKGVYPTREKCPWPAHPNTLSFLEIVFKDEIDDADKTGKETPVEALARLTPEQREGVLGKNKAEVFDAGQLKQGMIRAPLREVDARLKREENVDQRDELTKQHFNGRDITIGGYFKETALPGGVLDRETLPLLLGAPDGSRIHVGKRKAGFEFEVRNDLFAKPNVYVLDKTGVLHGIDLYLREDAPPGIGTRMMATTAQTAQAFGLREIQLVASGRPDNGYYTWPRLGFNAPLTETEHAALERIGLDSVQTLMDLMQTEKGREWWLANGTRREMFFLLDDESSSMKVLQAYLKEKGVTL